MGRRVFVVGVGMTKFEKPGRKDWDYPDMGRIAATRALNDACVSFDEVQQICCGYCYGDSTCGQRTAYQLGMTGVPVYNVNNNCATGSTALFMAKQFIEGGLADCVLALGFEKMERGSLGAKYTDRTNPMDKHMETMMDLREITAAPFTAQMFGNAGREHMEKFGTTKEQIAKIAHKNHKHSVNNPYSQFRDEYSLEQVMSSRPVYDPLTKLQCCPTSDGGAAAIVASEEFVRAHGLEGQAVEILGMAMATDLPSTFKDKSCIKIIGADMSQTAAQAAYKQAGVTADDIDVVELHDCFSANELVTYGALGLTTPEKAGEAIDRGDFTYGGRVVVNPSGGLISKGHPLGATGLAQCAEMCWQLRGEADKRQVQGAKTALSHNLGLGGAAVVTVYKRPEEWLGRPMKRPVSGGAGFAEDYPEEAKAEATAAPAKSQAAALFEQLGAALKSNPAIVKKVGAVFLFNLTGGAKNESFTVDLKNGDGSIATGEGAKPDCTFNMAEKDFMALMSGKANPQKLFMSGKLKMKGNMGKAMKLRELRTLQSKL